MDRFTTLLIYWRVLLFLWVTVLGLIFSDLWAGVRKAKKAGVYRTSDGYKKTIDKMARYYNMMLPLALMDTAVNGIVFYLHYFYHYDLVMLPWFSFVGAGYVAFVEITSIMEAKIILAKIQRYADACYMVTQGHRKAIEALPTVEDV